MANLILLLGDQLTHDISSLREGNPDKDCVLMVEVMEEATYAWHHKKKIAFLFSAMRHFAESLKEEGWTVDYVQLDDEENTGSFSGEVERTLKRRDAEALLVTSAGEYRVQEMMEGWEERFGLPVRILEDDRFICSREEFREWAEDRKQFRMEYFYREMRKKTRLLMENDGEPTGGEWNFDQQNRKPAKQDLFMPTPHQTEPDKITQSVLDMVSERFEDHPGKLAPFWFGVTHEDAQAVLDQFIAEALPCFGDYQDAMLKGEKFLYHSLLSLYINAGLLDPLEVCRRVDKAYRDGKAPLNSAEGFIRQILGWREYVRGVYWLKMPDYVDMNFLDAKRELPEFYWTGDTDMACLKAAIDQTLEEAYAHHIQRLMVTGNFALLAGIDPKAVHEWYLAVYADAYEWVELPNTLGMSQFADGGLLGSKPYAASGNYINKMSDYCGGCKYDVKQKTGEGSCPFNSLYWEFLIRNRSKLEDNPRMAQMYSTWERMSGDKQEAYLETAKAFLGQL
ncbi:cryptochrome/photolyase family protein [Hyphomonas pacifica]|uniref:Deoxyribodipyrimidine photo-lyase n=1 Tax=Hyphomonas pacifica TaxID=1280941 RepID=A0A062TWM7_9PROT|nr:cryptochrome/photolyase family protein [Hyphomonas pacifica]KCZ52436.1 hypothetical protein HY2_08460 [Hyphomonas pacifica]RAN35209.1 hypothetical protein HY3_09060 [Hyphomonas pacifica]